MPESIGNAYLTVKAQPDGSFESDLESAGSKGGSGFGSAFQVAAGTLMADAARALGSAVADTFTTAFSNYADYEQLVGGVDTLFKDSSAKVQEYAANAYQTAGLSANQYMEQVTSFSASLLSSLGGDTEKAADYADLAMTDMSDNANKMGTSMEAITNAYQGFAKQNYTMLDNLKLGYGGTKTEMERLLKDASEIAGVEFNIDSYADVVQAIHVIQDNMGITGTTAKEAASTISGSLGMLSASWQNLLTGLFDANADLATLIWNLFDSLGAVAKNVFPALANLISNLFKTLPGIINDAIANIPSAIGPTLDDVFGEEIGGKITGVLDDVSYFITDTVGPTVEWAADLIMPIVQKIGDMVAEVMPHILNIVSTVMNGIKAVVDFVWPAIDGIITAAIDIIKGAIEGLSSIVSTVAGIFDGVYQAIVNPIDTAKNIIGGIIDTIKGFFSFSIEWPHIPLPHFGINPPGWQIGDLLKGQLPSLGIEWYAQGGIVNSPTLFGAGEAGPEAIVPLTAPNLAPFANAVASAMGGRGIYIENMTVQANDIDEFVLSVERTLGRMERM